MRKRNLSALLALLVPAAPLLVLLASCGPEGAPESRRKAREHAGGAAKLLREDVRRHYAAMEESAERLAADMARADVTPQRLRRRLRSLREAPRGVQDLIVSPKSFVAAIGLDGKVIAKDADTDEDSMAGLDLGAIAPCVQGALAGRGAGHCIVEFANPTGRESSISLVFAHAVRHEGRLVGAVAAGIPLPALARRLSRQLQLDVQSEQPPPIVWALMWHRDRIHTAATPPEIDQECPRPAQIRQALGRSAGGYTDEKLVQSRWFGYAVLPVPSIGRDV
ncbi:MAG: hypothetical protein IT379_02625, partial [Deltaproteobacteria bacterium]|nr:hypothetical protein [Deltaproteobacteria bacterium]